MLVFQVFFVAIIGVEFIYAQIEVVCQVSAVGCFGFGTGSTVLYQMFGIVGQQNIVAELGYVAHAPGLAFHFTLRLLGHVVAVDYSVYNSRAEAVQFNEFHPLVMVIVGSLVGHAYQIVLKETAGLHVAVQGYAVSVLGEFPIYQLPCLRYVV